MSASASSLFTNFRPFFVSRYEGREELCREIQARRHHCKPSQCKVTAVPALLFVHSGRHGGTTIPPEAVGFRNAILLVEDGVELEAGDVITE